MLPQPDAALPAAGGPSPLGHVAATARALFGADAGVVVAGDGTRHVSFREGAASPADLGQLLEASLGSAAAVYEAGLIEVGGADAGPFAAAAPLPEAGGLLLVASLQPLPGDPGRLEALSALADLASRLHASLLGGQVGLDSLLEHSSDVIVVLDDLGRLTYASPSLEALTGYEPAEVVGRYGFELVHPDDRRPIIELFGRLHERPQGPLPVSFKLSRSDGGHLDVEAVTTSVVQDDAVHGIVINIRDVSVRRRIEEHARSRERHAQAVLDTLEEGVLVCAADGTVLSCNSSAERLLGRTAQQIVGAPYELLVDLLSGPSGRTIGESGVTIAPGEHPALLSLRRGEALAGVTLGRVRPDATVRWWRFSTEVLAVGGPAGPRAVVLSFEDVTERREAELSERAQREQGPHDRRLLAGRRPDVLR